MLNEFLYAIVIVTGTTCTSTQDEKKGTQRTSMLLLSFYFHSSKTLIVNKRLQLMSFFIGNQEKFQTNSSVHTINTTNKHHLHRSVANLSCFQKGASYSGIRIFNSLPRSITNLTNEKTIQSSPKKVFKCTLLLLCG
jgi:hypothetical protein